ncbi:MAG: MFS transporter [Firmicutes bacterium]|nr:MFS transporter [Bacillota bacterium]
MALLATLSSSFLVVLNTTNIRVASPEIMTTFGVAPNWLSWLLTGYALPYAVLLTMFGRLGDLYGRKRVFVTGVACFILASAVCAISPTFTLLTMARTLQGISSAMIFPNSMALATGLYPPEMRGQVIGWWNTVGSVGAVLGPSIGGMVVEFLDWRWIFLMNVPVGLIVLLVIVRGVPERRRAAAPGAPDAPATPAFSKLSGFDLPGAGTLAAALIPFLVALTIAPDTGFNLTVLVLFAAALAAGALFLRIERTHPNPLADLSLFRHRTFNAGFLVGFCNGFTINGSSLLIPLYLSLVFGFGPAQIGLLVLANALARVVISPFSGWLTDRRGLRPATVIGGAMEAAGFLLFAFLGPRGGMAWLVTGMILYGFGSSMLKAPSFSAILSCTPRRRSSSVLGLFHTNRQAAGLIGNTLTAVILYAFIPGGGESLAPGILSGAASGAGAAGSPAGSALPWGIAQAIPGFREAFLLSALVALAAAFLAAALPQGVRRPDQVSDHQAGKETPANSDHSGQAAQAGHSS